MLMMLRMVRKTVIVACLVGALPSYAQQPLEVEYVRPGADASKYTGILIRPMDLSRAKVVPPPWADDRSPSAWALKPENINIFQERYHDVMTEEIEADGNYKVVSEPGPGVLELDVRITSVTPYAKRGEDVIK